MPDDCIDLFESETIAHLGTVELDGRSTSHPPGSTTTPNVFGCWSTVGEVVATTEDGAREHVDELSRRYVGREYENSIGTERVVLEIRVDRALDS